MEEDIHTNSSVPRIAVLVSGRGSNLEALIHAVKTQQLRAEIALVISSKSSARALDIAKAAGIPCEIVSPAQYPSRKEEGLKIVELLQTCGAQLAVTAGYSRIFDPCVIEAFRLKIINIHPSLLPAFAGSMAPGPQKRALESGVKISGCTTHFITEDTDAGPIIAQRAVPVMNDDTVETLADRILEAEHQLLPESVQMALDGRVTVEGNKTIVTSERSVYAGS